MKALSVRQPWAYCLFHGKDVENRLWPLPRDIKGMLIAIHASGYEYWEWSELSPQQYKAIGGGTGGELPLGAIIGTGYFNGCLSRGESGLWKVDGQFGFRWILGRQLQTPIPYKGALGFFKLSPDVEAQVLAQMGY